MIAQWFMTHSRITSSPWRRGWHRDAEISWQVYYSWSERTIPTAKTPAETRRVSKKKSQFRMIFGSRWECSKIVVISNGRSERDVGWFHWVLFERAVYTSLQSSKTLSTTFWQPCIIASQIQKATMESLSLAKCIYLNKCGYFREKMTKIWLCLLNTADFWVCKWWMWRIIIKRTVVNKISLKRKYETMGTLYCGFLKLQFA